MASEHDGYVLARTEDERQRLLEQARVWAPATQRALANAGLAAGQHALDVGCGPGAVMRLMAERVGAEGRVTGTDIDAGMGRASVAALNAEGPPVFDFVDADLAAERPLPGSYDLVFARLVLFHMNDVQAALRRLWDAVRPGGALLVMDYDTSGIRGYPALAPVDRAMRLLNDAFRRGGRDIEAGTRLPAWFVQSGIGRPDGCVADGLVLPMRAAMPMLRGVVGSLRPLIVQTGMASAGALDDLDAELATVAAGPAGLTHVARIPDLVSTWKRKT